MGRAPCCDKANVKKGPWSPEEDAKLKAYIEQHGTGGNWISLPQKIDLKRCGKSCRLRWLNYLRPNIKHGGFSEEEDNIICNLYISIGSRWSIIAAQLPGRTDNDIKNYWNTKLKKKLWGKQRKEHQTRRANCLKQAEMNKKSAANLMVGDGGMQNPYWPEPGMSMPMFTPYSNQDTHVNDHASIRKLLIKLGGRFSDDQQQEQMDEAKNLQTPLPDIASTDQQFNENSINLLSSSSSSMNSLSNLYPQLINNQYEVDVSSMQGLNTFPVDQLDEMIFSNPQKLEGLECYYGLNIDNGSNGQLSAESTSWDDMGSFSHPPTLSNYEGLQQQIAHVQDECVFEESRYLGL